MKYGDTPPMGYGSIDSGKAVGRQEDKNNEPKRNEPDESSRKKDVVSVNRGNDSKTD